MSSQMAARLFRETVHNHFAHPHPFTRVRVFGTPLTPRAALTPASSSSPTASAARPFTMSQPVARSRHPDFKTVEASRPPWDDTERFHYTRTVNPDWRFGDGANRLAAAGDDKTQPKDQEQKSQTKRHVAIDPYAEGRAPGHNYKLLISAVTPRPIAFISTLGADGRAVNLAPFSYFNMMSHDPPLFVVGFDHGGGRNARGAKDTLANVLATREAVINIIGEDFIEAANACSIDAPYGASEWDVSGLTPLRDCETVRPARVAEAVFSVEVKVDHVREYERRGGGGKPGQPGSTLVVFEGTRMWVREDALNEEQNLVDAAVLRPMSRLGGITYGRLTQAIEIPRPTFDKDLGGEEGLDKLKGLKN
ncbi:patatin-like phospholipase domain-containing protein [Purpureocillium lavendulum]|uniref:Patatin-like phospholipase domain-containing protein n=1 Tax=Purpureocillium lavendulum TaxID=1247861 RepID=A0AB34G5Z6_9HYPO|nr:patatin-like phospholipase domain-containing protein [Purpureocillium lavendulum]